MSEDSFGDLAVFINWMKHVENAIGLAAPLPPIPSLDSSTVHGWIQAIHRLGKRARQAERGKLVAEATALAQEVTLGQLLSLLHMNMTALYEHLKPAHKATELWLKAEAMRYIY